MTMQNMHSEAAVESKGETPLDCLIDHLTEGGDAACKARQTPVSALLAAASSASSAATDLVEAARDETISSRDPVEDGATLALLVDAVRLVIGATGDDERDGQLLGAVEKWLDENQG